LSVGLGTAAGNQPEDMSPIVIEKTVPPSDSPTIAPTMPPKDFDWCFGINETISDDERYASIQSALISAGASTKDEFSNNTSYQRKSICWLTFGDRLQIDASDPFLEQRYALAAIYYGFNEPRNLESQGWLSGKPECDWEPITCDLRTDSTVSRLQLQGNKLVGTLPKEMSILKDIDYIDLSTNDLDGDVSEVMGGWSHLEELRLSSNRFDGIPSLLNDWKDLKHFDISDNGIEGHIPDSLALHSQLIYLDIASNDFIGTISSVFGNMTSLASLFMHGNLLNGTMPDAICDLRSGELDHLTVDCEKFREEVVCDMPSCCTQCEDYDNAGLQFDE